MPNLPFPERVERQVGLQGAYDRAKARGAQCDHCPLHGVHAPVMGEIRTDSHLVIIGEAPGENEIEQGQPFVGWSGQVLNGALLTGGLNRGHTSLTNATLCCPPGGSFSDYLEKMAVQQRKLTRQWRWEVAEARKAGLEPPEPPKPPLTPQEACLERLKLDIEQSGAKTLLAVGQRALESIARLAPEARIKTLREQHGAPVDLGQGRTLMSSYHPAMAARSKREMMPIIEGNIARAAQVAQHGWSWPEPPYWINPSPDQVINFLTALHSQQCELTVDIETGPSAPGRKDAANVYTNVLRCIGIGASAYDANGQLIESIMTVPVRHMDGSLWYSAADTERVRRAVANLLDALPLVGQNFQFDTSVLLRDGYMTDREKSWTDLLLLHRNSCDNDLPHNLSFLARQFFTLPVWKGVDHNSQDNAGDQALHIYCAKDVLTSMRLIPVLRQRTAQYSCEDAYRVDVRMAPVCREMGRVGLPINEHTRGDFSRKFNLKCQEYAQKARDIIGRDINLNSPDQLKDLLYGDPKFGGWGLTPRIATDGFEWDPDKEGSTGGQALVELRKCGLEDEQTAFIDTLLNFRAYAKLKGTYTDNLPTQPATFDVDLPPAPAVTGWRWDGKLHMDEWEEVLPARPGMTVFHPTFKNYVVPSGRLSSSPNAQAIPAVGKANMREMFEAPPGHVFVGADWSQLEARIYAVVSQDQVLLEAIKSKHPDTGHDYDIHSINAASLFATDTSKLEQMYWYNKIEYGIGMDADVKGLNFADALRKSQEATARIAAEAGDADPITAFKRKHKKMRKRLRNIAKRFCLAEGTLVLTDRGSIPIEKVRVTDKVWDGVEWVNHDGVIYQGEKEVMTYDGVCGTPDHEVFVHRNGTLEKTQLQNAAKKGWRIYNPSLPYTHGKKETRTPDNNGRRSAQNPKKRRLDYARNGYKETRSLLTWGHVRSVVCHFYPLEGCRRAAHKSAFGVYRRLLRWCDTSFQLGQSEKWEEYGLPQVYIAEKANACVASHALQRNATALYQQKQQSLSFIWGSRHRISVRICGSCGTVDHGQLRASQRPGARSHRFLWSLCTGESAMASILRKLVKGITQRPPANTRTCDLFGAGMATFNTHSEKIPKRGPDSHGDHRKSTATRRVENRRLDFDKDKTGKDGPTVTRVYDILNAGPRKRFTVVVPDDKNPYRLVKNCFLLLYGGEKEKLYSVMSSDRDKVTGELSFKTLTPDQCLMWYDNWHSGHPETSLWHNSSSQAVKRTGHIRVPLLDQRARWFLYGASKKNAVPNHQIQGCAAAFANDSLLKIAEAIPFRAWSPHSGLCLQVHDDIKVIVPEDRAEEAKHILESIMCREWGGIPFPADAVISKRWAEQDI